MTSTPPVTDAAPPDPFHDAFLFQVPCTELVLVRHAQQDRRGVSAREDLGDRPLSELGLRQADAVGRYLAEEPLAAIYCSTLDRSRTTAAAVASQGVGRTEPVLVPGLCEVDVFGLLPEGQHPTPQELQASYDGFARTRRFDDFAWTESSAAFRGRVMHEIAILLARHRDERIAVVVHGGVMGALVAEAFGMHPDMPFFSAHASVSRLRHRDGRWVIGAIHEVPHLTGDLLTY